MGAAFSACSSSTMAADMKNFVRAMGYTSTVHFVETPAQVALDKVASAFVAFTAGVGSSVTTATSGPEAFLVMTFTFANVSGYAIMPLNTFLPIAFGTALSVSTDGAMA